MLFWPELPLFSATFLLTLDQMFTNSPKASQLSQHAGIHGYIPENPKCLKHIYNVQHNINLQKVKLKIPPKIISYAFSGYPPV